MSNMESIKSTVANSGRRRRDPRLEERPKRLIEHHQRRFRLGSERRQRPVRRKPRRGATPPAHRRGRRQRPRRLNAALRPAAAARGPATPSPRSASRSAASADDLAPPATTLTVATFSTARIAEALPAAAAASGRRLGIVQQGRIGVVVGAERGDQRALADAAAPAVERAVGQEEIQHVAVAQQVFFAGPAAHWCSSSRSRKCAGRVADRGHTLSGRRDRRR